MKFETYLAVAATTFLLSVPGFAAELVSPFSGSEELATYATQFDRFRYLAEVGDSVEAVSVEGKLSSRLFSKPTDKSTYEVFRSYQKELAAAGFEMLAVLDGSEKPVKNLSREINQGNGTNELAARAYQHNGKPPAGSPQNWLAQFTEHYIAAQKTEDGISYLVVVLIADRKDLYTVDVFETAAMEENTVALSLDALKSQMAADGRVALYGILFDTGSATLRDESNDALDTISEYLIENPSQVFYVVGHTDDEGPYAANIKLSQARAESTRAALITRLGSKDPTIDSRLTAHGVGPLSPVANNAQPDGRQLNRRVELVSASR